MSDTIGICICFFISFIAVSLSDNPVEEIKVAKEILKDCGLYKKSPTLVSCPTCGKHYS